MQREPSGKDEVGAEPRTKLVAAGDAARIERGVGVPRARFHPLFVVEQTHVLSIEVGAVVELGSPPACSEAAELAEQLLETRLRARVRLELLHGQDVELE